MWHVPQGCPVCRAKLGKACAGVIEPIVNTATDMNISANAAKSHLTFHTMTL